MEKELKEIADKEELLKVYDENHNFTNRYEIRSVVHNNNLFHNEISLWVINPKTKQVLLEKRSPYKKQSPNKYALCAGHVVGDETIEEALYKESSEEIGLDLNNYEVHPLSILKRTEQNNHCFSHHFYIFAEIPTSEFVIQEIELSSVEYIDFKELKNLVMKNDERFVFRWNEVYKDLFEKLENIIYQE